MDNRKQSVPVTGAPTSLSTPWSAEVDPALPLAEYPRPSLVRAEWLCLNGPWDYSIHPAPAVARTGGRAGEARPLLPAIESGSITVPYPIESALSGVGRPLLPEEVLRYSRKVEVPGTWKGKRILLHVGACDWEARVLVNGRLAGSHRGGYAPFSFDITDLLGEGGEIAIEVSDPTDSGVQCRGKQSLKPGGIWYTAASGIWGTVWLEPVSASHIAGLCPHPDLPGKRLLVEVEVAVPQGAPDPRISGRLREGGVVVATAEAIAKADGKASTDANAARLELSGSAGPAVGSRLRKAVLEFAVLRPRLWSPDSPFLYGLELELEGGGLAGGLAGSGDRAESYAAMRSVSVGPDAAGRPRILLNGEPLFHNAVLDQGYWPEGVYTAPTDAALLSDIKAAKAFGFNTIRKHAKVESERWYWHCDREGVLVWQDIPSGGAPMTFLHSAILGFAGIRLRDDRGLGRFGRTDAAGRADFEREAAEIVDFLRGFPCIVAWVPFNEGWGQFESRRVASHIAALDPSRIVDAVSGWYDRGAGHLASRHDYSRKPRLPSARRGRVAAISEFGGLTLRIEEHSVEDERQFGYRRVRDGAELASRYEELVAGRLAALAGKGLAASVYTQITDVEIERNGLLTYDRRLQKADVARIRAANLALIAAAKRAAEPGKQN
jgi:beta-galactosidase/beta-glucuronidase